MNSQSVKICEKENKQQKCITTDQSNLSDKSKPPVSSSYRSHKNNSVRDCASSSHVPPTFAIGTIQISVNGRDTSTFSVSTGNNIFVQSPGLVCGTKVDNQTFNF